MDGLGAFPFWEIHLLHPTTPLQLSLRLPRRRDTADLAIESWKWVSDSVSSDVLPSLEVRP